MGSLSAQASSRIVKSVDGTEIYAEALGDPSKPALVLIHGFSMSSIAFEPIFNDAKWLDQVYLVRYDVRGHGKSGKPVDESAWESKRLCEDFDAVAQAFSLKKPFVLGWSAGATSITDILAVHPPSYVSGIIYANALPYMGPVLGKVGTPEVLQCLPPLMQSTDVDAFQAAAQTFVSLLSQTLPRIQYQACLGDLMTQPRAVTTRFLTRTHDEKGLLEAGNSGLPLLVVNAKLDRIVDGTETLNAVSGWKNIQVVGLEQADHMPWYSQPDEFRDSTLGWVAKFS